MKTVKVMIVLLLLLTGCTNKEHDQPFMNEEITIIAPSSSGGGWDLTAKAIQQSLSNSGTINNEIRVVNKIGAGGEVGWKYISKQEGHVLAMNSSLLITNHILGRSKLTFKDFTPIATLATEWQVVIVAKDSAIESAKTLMNHIKLSPESYKIGISPRLGNDDQLSFVLASRQVGIEPANLHFQVYENSKHVVEALRAKEVDIATMTISEAMKYYHLNQVKLLVVSSDSRLDELPDIPTWKEEGIDLVFKHWRGIMGPPNMTKKEISFWDKTFGEMVKTNQWKQTLEMYMWNDFYKDSEETYQYLEEQSKMYEKLMGVH